jgi:hypothetical protein
LLKKSDAPVAYGHAPPMLLRAGTADKSGTQQQLAGKQRSWLISYWCNSMRIVSLRNALCYDVRHSF